MVRECGLLQRCMSSANLVWRDHLILGNDGFDFAIERVENSGGKGLGLHGRKRRLERRLLGLDDDEDRQMALVGQGPGANSARQAAKGWQLLR